MPVSPPSQADTRGAMADWLELQALAVSRGVASRATILHIMDMLEDDAAVPDAIDVETGERLDSAILEDERQKLVEITFEELSYRSEKLGDSYPFSVDAAKYRLTREVARPLAHVGQIVYLFCLLSSAIRERKLEPQPKLVDAEKAIADAFQVCACLAAGGYLNVHVSSFGFPRATGSNFLDALRQTFKRFGYGDVRASDDIPLGLPTSIKDGGIDVIAWRGHPDEMPGKVCLFGQCASGQNWRDKSVVEFIPLLAPWFTLQPAQHSTPAMFIPFTFSHDMSEVNGSYLDAVRNRFAFDERRFGIVFDRLRIAHFANSCMAFSKARRSGIDGADRLNSVKKWVRGTCRTAGLCRL